MSDRDNTFLHPHLTTDEGMASFMDELFGAGVWYYDDDEDLWIALDRKHTGPEIAFVCVSRGGEWLQALVTDDEARDLVPPEQWACVGLRLDS